jgi:hypothetical protein
MPEKHCHTLSGKIGHGKRPGVLLPALIDYPGLMIALDVKEERFQEQHDGQEENPFWRDRAEEMLHALTNLAGSNQPEAMQQAMASLSGVANGGNAPAPPSRKPDPEV